MWSLAPGMHHLNHGSFGAVPVEVQERQNEWRARWEANTTAFIANDYYDAISEARAGLSRFIGASEGGLAFVRNASQGIAAVARSIEGFLGPGDEILVTNHDYNAVRQTLEYTSRQAGAEVVVVEVPFPLEGPDVVYDTVIGAVTDRTKLLVIDHVTSPTGLIFPIERIIDEVEPDIPVLIDGAHGPGQVPLDVDALGASWYTGNLHKWLCAPKGAGFLATREDKIEMTVPTVISHAWNTPYVEGGSRYQGLFDWTGTDDFTPWLTVPYAIRQIDAEAGGWEAVMEQNHQLALEARQVVLEVMEMNSPAPDEMIGSMFSLPLPDIHGENTGSLMAPLNGTMIDEGFEAAVFVWPDWPKQMIRLSAHLYNEIGQYKECAETLRRLVG